MATCKGLGNLTTALDKMQTVTLQTVTLQTNNKIETKIAENPQKQIKKSKKIKGNRKDGKIAITVLVDEKTFFEWENFFKSHDMDKATGIRKAVKYFIDDINNGRQFLL